MKVLKVSSWLLTLSLSQLIIASNSYASGPFSITNRTFGSAVPAAAQTELNTLFNEVENQVNTKLPNTGGNPDNYAKGMANSGVTAAKGLGVDYASHPDLFIVGAGVGVAGDLGGQSISDVTSGKVKATEIRGVGLQASIMAGLNLGFFTESEVGPFELKKTKVFLNYFTKKMNSASLTGKMTDFGVHVQYDFFDEVALPLGFIKWYGLQVTTGFEYSLLDAHFTKTIDQPQTRTIDVSSITMVSGQTATATARFNGTANVGAEAKVKSIPIEVSTSARILYVLTPFIGLGSDFNFGGGKTIANVSGPVTITDSLGAFSSANNTQISANANLNLDSHTNVKPDFFNARWFGGLQFNIFIVKVYLQYTQSFTNDTLGVNGGLRIAW